MLRKKTVSPVQESGDDIFGEMVAFELKQISEHMRIQIKHEINKPIYNYQMQAQNVIPLVTIQAPVQTHVHNTLSLPPLRSFQSQEQAPLQVSFQRYPPPGWYDNSVFNASS